MAASPYGYHWRTVTRPNTLLLGGGHFHDTPLFSDRLGRYTGGAKCLRCGWVEPPLAKGQRSRIQIAHLDGDVWNDAPENLECLCDGCHKKNDYHQWCRRCWETRSLKKDQKRPLLVVVA